jgi:molybdenum cofactor biosynthesis enzyme MoaA
MGLESLAMTTNGITLEKHLDALVDAGLNSINISLDTLVPAKFTFITRRQGWERVMSSIRAAVRKGLSPVKVRGTCLSHTLSLSITPLGSASFSSFSLGLCVCRSPVLFIPVSASFDPLVSSFKL